LAGSARLRTGYLSADKKVVGSLMAARHLSIFGQPLFGLWSIIIHRAPENDFSNRPDSVESSGNCQDNEST
jgi:hypothetical protein